MTVERLRALINCTVKLDGVLVDARFVYPRSARGERIHVASVVTARSDLVIVGAGMCGLSKLIPAHHAGHFGGRHQNVFRRSVKVICRWAFSSFLQRQADRGL